MTQLIQHIPKESLPRHLGGTVDVEHDKWLSYCLNYMTNSDKYGSSAMSDHICNSNSTKKETGPESKVCIYLKYSHSSDILVCHLSMTIFHVYNLLFFINHYTFFQTNNLLKENNVVNEESAVVHDNLLSGWTCNTTNSKGRCNNIEKLVYPFLFRVNYLFLFYLYIEEISPMPPSSVSSGFSDDDSLRCDSSQSLTISQFVEYVLKKKRAGLIREYEEIKTRSSDGTFNVAK